MACLLYVPKRAIIPAHQSQFSSGSQVELFFDLEDYNIKPQKVKNITRALDGRPCVTGGARTLDVTVSTLSIPKKFLPQWVEFQRSTDCGEEVEIKQLPCLSIWRVKGNAIITGDVNFSTPPGNKVFKASFTLTFWEFTS